MRSQRHCLPRRNALLPIPIGGEAQKAGAELVSKVAYRSRRCRLAGSPTANVQRNQATPRATPNDSLFPSHDRRPTRNERSPAASGVDPLRIPGCRRNAKRTAATGSDSRQCTAISGRGRPRWHVAGRIDGRPPTSDRERSARIARRPSANARARPRCRQSEPSPDACPKRRSTNASRATDPEQRGRHRSAWRAVRAHRPVCPPERPAR